MQPLLHMVRRPLYAYSRPAQSPVKRISAASATVADLMTKVVMPVRLFRACGALSQLGSGVSDVPSFYDGLKIVRAERANNVSAKNIDAQADAGEPLPQ